MKLKKQALTLLKILFAVGLVFWLVKTDRFKLEELRPFLGIENFLVGFSIVGLNLFLMSERWRLLMRAHELHGKAWAVWKLNLTGIFFNFAVPGGVGGDVVKAYYLQKDLNSSRAAAFSSALMDRIVGLYTCVFMAFIALVYERSVMTNLIPLLEKLFLWVSLLFGGMTIGMILVAFFKWPNFFKNAQGIVGRVYRLVEACQYFFRKPSLLVYGFLVTFIAQLITIIFFHWAFQDVLGEAVSWSLLFFVVPVGFMIMAVPITPAGLGVGQAVFYFLFQTFSQNEVLKGSTVITAFQLIQFAWGLLGAYYYLTRKTRLPLTVVEESK